MHKDDPSLAAIPQQVWLSSLMGSKAEQINGSVYGLSGWWCCLHASAGPQGCLPALCPLFPPPLYPLLPERCTTEPHGRHWHNAQARHISQLSPTTSHPAANTSGRACTAQQCHLVPEPHTTEVTGRKGVGERQLAWMSGTCAHRQVRSGCCAAVLHELVPQL